MPQSLYPLLLLACPVAMGLMMWVMMRGGSHASRYGGPSSSPSALVELREEIAGLRAAQNQKDTPRPPGP